jgi:hypothetical protein
MQAKVTLKELITFSKDMAEKFPDKLVNLNSEHMWVTAQWARVACQDTNNAFDMSTYNDIEMLDEQGDSFVIEVSEVFSKWNQEIVRKSSCDALWRWGSIVDMLENL